MNSWQDLLLSICSVLFTVALIPSLKSKNKPAFATSFMTFLLLATSLIAYASLKLWYTTAITVITAILWLTLAIQRLRQIKKPTHTTKKDT